MSRGQISGQVFVYILAAVVIGVILLIGYKAIATVLGFFSKAPIDGFKSDFTSKVEEMSRGYGSKSRFSLSFPSKYEEICVIDSMDDTDHFRITASVASNEYIKDVIETNVQKNVFLMQKGSIQESFYVKDLDVKEDYVCIENAGKPAVWFESMGKTACLTLTKTETC